MRLICLCGSQFMVVSEVDNVSWNITAVKDGNAVFTRNCKPAQAVMSLVKQAMDKG